MYAPEGANRVDGAEGASRAVGCPGECPRTPVIRGIGRRRSPGRSNGFGARVDGRVASVRNRTIHLIGRAGVMAVRPEGAPCWADAMFSDLEGAKRFYGEVLGWT